MWKKLFTKDDGSTQNTSAVRAEVVSIDPVKNNLLQHIQDAEQELNSFRQKKHANDQRYQDLQKQIAALENYINNLPAESPVRSRFQNQLTLLKAEAQGLFNEAKQSQEVELNLLGTQLADLQNRVNSLQDSEEDQLLRPIFVAQIEALQQELQDLQRNNIDDEERNILDKIHAARLALVKYLVAKIVNELKAEYLNKIDVEYSEFKQKGIEQALAKRGIDSPLLYIKNLPLAAKLLETTGQKFLSGMFETAKSNFVASLDDLYIRLCQQIDPQSNEEQINQISRAAIMELVEQSKNTLAQQQDLVLQPIKNFIQQSKARQEIEDSISNLDKAIGQTTRNLTEEKYLTGLTADGKRLLGFSRQGFERIKQVYNQVINFDLVRYEEMKPLLTASESIITELYTARSNSYYEQAVLQSLLPESVQDGTDLDIQEEILSIEQEICRFSIKIQEERLESNLSQLRNNFVSNAADKKILEALTSKRSITKLGNIAQGLFTHSWNSYRNAKTNEQQFTEDLSELEESSDQIIIDKEDLLKAYRNYTICLQNYHNFLKRLKNLQPPISAEFQSNMILLALEVYYSYAGIPTIEQDAEYKTYLQAYAGIIAEYRLFNASLVGTKKTTLEPDHKTLAVIKLLLSVFEHPNVINELPGIIDDLLDSVVVDRENVELYVERLPETVGGELDQQGEEEKQFEVDKAEAEASDDEEEEEEILFTQKTVSPEPPPAAPVNLSFKEKLAQNMSPEQRELFLRGAPKLQVGKLPQLLKKTAGDLKPAEPKQEQLGLAAVLKNALNQKFQLANDDNASQRSGRSSPSFDA